MPGLQKVKVFANANVVGLEKEMNSWLRSTSPPPDIKHMQLTAWGSSEGAGEYTIVCLMVHE